MIIAPPPPAVIIPPPPFQGKRHVTFDVECYANYFLLTICDAITEEVLREYQMYNDVRNHDSLQEVHDFLMQCTIISFNGNKYDILIVTAYINGASNYQMKEISDLIIPKDGRGMMPWDFERRYSIKIPKFDHIDLIELTPGMHSLKVYGARLRSVKLQELPIHPHSIIMPHQVQPMRSYCINDNIVTKAAYDSVKLAIDLRIEMSAEYGFDLRSKSDAQAAEAIVAHEAERLTGVVMRKPDMKSFPREFKYHPPEFIAFTRPRMNELVDLCESLTYVLSDKHKLKVPKEFGVVRFYNNEDHGHAIEEDIFVADSTRTRIDEANNLTQLRADLAKIKKSFGAKNDQVIAAGKELKELNDSCGYTQASNELSALRKTQREMTIREYTMQIGGLHSKHDAGSFYSDDDYQIFEIDVSSFYPNIIIQAGLYIKSLGKEVFQTIYQGLIDRKNNASEELKQLKEQGITDGARVKELKAIIKAVKIFVNGLYGKLSSHYSKVYSPDMLIGTTITGQLSLLMLLEIFHLNGIHVLSANTDGINVRVHRDQRAWVDSVVNEWCTETGFVMDYNYYKSIHYRDVNNYFAHYEDDSVKGIGIFAAESLDISPEYFIVRDALFEYVKDGTPIEETINNCDDIHMFVNLRKVSGGAHKDGEVIGKAVRWYHSIATGTAIHDVKSGNKVAGSQGGVPVMDYPEEIPYDLDRQWYVNKAYKTMAVCGLLTEDLVYLHHEDSDTLLTSTKDGDWVGDVAEGSLTIIERADFLKAVGIKNVDIRKYKI